MALKKQDNHWLIIFFNCYLWFNHFDFIFKVRVKYGTKCGVLSNENWIAL